LKRWAAPRSATAAFAPALAEQFRRASPATRRQAVRTACEQAVESTVLRDPEVNDALAVLRGTLACDRVLRKRLDRLAARFDDEYFDLEERGGQEALAALNFSKARAVSALALGLSTDEEELDEALYESLSALDDPARAAHRTSPQTGSRQTIGLSSDWVVERKGRQARDGCGFRHRIVSMVRLVADSRRGSRFRRRLERAEWRRVLRQRGRRGGIVVTRLLRLYSREVKKRIVTWGSAELAAVWELAAVVLHDVTDAVVETMGDDLEYVSRRDWRDLEAELKAGSVRYLSVAAREHGLLCLAARGFGGSAREGWERRTLCR
jgi:hypothetical protein